VGKPTLYAALAFCVALVVWSTSAAFLASVLGILKQGALAAYFWLAVVDWDIGFVIAVSVAWLAYWHFSD